MACDACWSLVPGPEKKMLLMALVNREDWRLVFALYQSKKKSISLSKRGI